MSDEATGLNYDSGVTNIEPDNIHYAGFWIRLVAGIIDGVILSFVGGIIQNISLYFWAIHPVAGAPIHQAAVTMTIWVTVFQVLVCALYESLLLSSSWMATLGMKAVGIKILDYSYERISFGRAVGRYFAQWLSGILLGIGFLMIAFTPRKQGLHDKIAKTLVIYSR
jgi:uncharacterized RDD family membrane protein YckC